MNIWEDSNNSIPVKKRGRRSKFLIYEDAGNMEEVLKIIDEVLNAPEVKIEFNPYPFFSKAQEQFEQAMKEEIERMFPNKKAPEFALESEVSGGLILKIKI